MARRSTRTPTPDDRPSVSPAHDATPTADEYEISDAALRLNSERLSAMAEKHGGWQPFAEFLWARFVGLAHALRITAEATVLTAQEAIDGVTALDRREKGHRHGQQHSAETKRDKSRDMSREIERLRRTRGLSYAVAARSYLQQNESATSKWHTGSDADRKRMIENLVRRERNARDRRRKGGH